MARRFSEATEICGIQRQGACRPDQQVQCKYEFIGAGPNAHIDQRARIELAFEQQTVRKTSIASGQNNKHHPGEHEQEADNHQRRGSCNHAETKCREQDPGKRHRAVNQNTHAPAIIHLEEKKEAAIQEAIFNGQETDDQKSKYE